MARKKCIACGNGFPATSKHFYSHPRFRDGLSGKCKPCSRAYTRAYDAKRRALRPPKPVMVYIVDGKKICSNCNEWLPATNEYFFNSKQHTTGLQSWCKRCMRAMKMGISTTRRVVDTKTLMDQIRTASHKPTRLDHIPAVDCAYTCPVCGMGVDMKRKQFQTQDEADACCMGVPAHVEAEHTLAYLRLGVLRKYDHWVHNSSRISFGQNR